MRAFSSVCLVLPTLWLLAACGDDNGGDQPTPVGGAGGGGAAAGATAGRGGSTNSGGSGGGSSGTGGKSTGGNPSMGGTTAGKGGSESEGGAGQGGAGGVIECGDLPKPPASFDVLFDFTKSEDFAFDAQGNYVGVDDDGNLVRIDHGGNKQLWAPGMPMPTAGIQMLPDGSVVIADVANGALLRVYENGSRKVLLGGLLYPNGLDVGPDGFVYVSENAAGRVRRIDPETGDFTIVALGLYGPNGVAFGNDPKIMYIGSFEGSGVFKVVLDKPGELGVASVFARPNGSNLPEPKLACPEQKEGTACETTMGGESGKCKRLANVVDCIPENSCAGVPDDTACMIGDEPGKCFGGMCVPPSACEGKPDGTKCEDEQPGGVCMGGFCEVPDECTGKPDGTTCGNGGSCNQGFCEVPEPCEGKKVGDACEVVGVGTGTCDAFEDFMWCSLTDPCKGKPDGEKCHPLFEDDADGVCQFETCVSSSCGPDCVLNCTEQDIGKACSITGVPGICTSTDQGVICKPSDNNGSPGGIDGLGVDACGNVYASEFTHGIVWRISPTGKIEHLVDLPSNWVPNIKWGRGVGGFGREQMFVADRQDGRLFAVSVGVPGAREFYDGAK